MKEEETQLKSQLSELNKEYDKLDARVGLLGHKSLLADYSKTLKHLDNVRKGAKNLSINDDQIQAESNLILLELLYRQKVPFFIFFELLGYEKHLIA